MWSLQLTETELEGTAVNFTEVVALWQSSRLPVPPAFRSHQKPSFLIKANTVKAAPAWAVTIPSENIAETDFWLGHVRPQCPRVDRVQ